MKVRRQFFLEIFFIFLLSMISAGLLLFEPIEIHVISMILIVIGSMFFVKFDIFHPYVWFGGAYLLYSIAYPILFVKDSIYAQIGYSKELIIMQWLAYFVFILIVTPKRIKNYSLNNFNNESFANNIVYFISCIVVFFTIVLLANYGTTNKQELQNSSFMIFFGLRMALVLLIVYVLKMVNLFNKELKQKITLMATVFILIFFVFYFSGERDYLYRYFILTAFIFYAFSDKNQKKYFYYIFIPFFIVILPLVNSFKYFGITGQVSNKGVDFIEKFFIADFISASRNIQFLINNESLWDPFHGYTFWIGIIRGIEPPFINFIDFGAVRWFNETFFSADRAGQGFTLVGEGYINFGYFGIIILFIFVGLLIKFLYLKSNKNIYWFTIYLLSIPTFMYSIRADLANIISPLFSQIITTILIILLTNYLGKQLANKTNK